MDLCLTKPTTSRRCPDKFVNSFNSRGLITIPNVNGNAEDWVICKFSVNCDSLLYLGGNDGSLALFDVQAAADDPTDVQGGILHSFMAHKGVVMDINSVPQTPQQVLTVSGDATVRLWDVNQRQPQSTLFSGHDATVRAASFALDSPNVFATGSRDGQVRIWDTRIKSMHKEKRSGLQYIPSIKTFANSHAIKEIGFTRKTPRKKDPPPKVVSVLYLNEYEVISGSDCAASGLRVWDTRKMTVNEEGHILRTLQIPVQKKNKRDVGVSSLALDRFGSSLYAAITSNVVYEYAVTSNKLEPIRSLVGGSLGNYDIMLCSSPVSDHVLCGTADEQAILWSLQDFHKYQDCTNNSILTNHEQNFSHSFGGHTTSVTSVSWSSKGNYIVSMDENSFRVWACDVLDPDVDINKIREEFPNYETVNVAERPITRSHYSPRKGLCTPLKTKELLSPVKSGTKTLVNTPVKTPCKSPRAKRTKYSSPVLPLLEITNRDEVTPQFRRKRRPKKNIFHSRYPTVDLPNFVYEKFLKDLGSSSDSEYGINTPSTSCRKRLDDYWEKTPTDGQKRGSERLKRTRVPSSSEFTESVCAKMMTEDERVIHNSPRKLILRKSPQKRIFPSTHCPSENRSTHSRKLNRNLLDYFTKSN